jgi:hypothetical protein
MSYLSDRLDAFCDELVKIGAEHQSKEESLAKRFGRFTTSPIGRVTGLASVGAGLGGATIPQVVDLVRKGEFSGRASGAGMLAGAVAGAGLGYLLRNKDPLFGVRKDYEKTAGMFSRIGKGIANTLERSKASRGVLSAPPPMPAAPAVGANYEKGRQAYQAFSNMKRKALGTVGVLGVGAAGGAYAMHRAHQDSLGKLTGQ